jgi:hypothetical protein
MPGAPFVLERRPLTVPCTAESLQAEADLVAGGSLRLLREHFRAAQERHPANHRLQSHLYVCLPALERLIRAQERSA